MKKSVRLKPVRDIKHMQERTEAKKLADLQQQLLQAKSQRTELEGYLKEYFNSVSAQRQLVRQASQLALYQAFVDRLQQAIQHQNQVILQRETAVNAQTRRWFAASERLKKMEELIQRSQVEEQQEVDKREQKQLDDRPLRNRTGFD